MTRRTRVQTIVLMSLGAATSLVVAAMVHEEGRQFADVMPLPEAWLQARQIPSSPEPVDPLADVAEIVHKVPVAAETATAEAAPPTRPAWVDEPGHLDGHLYRVPVKSGLFVSRADCEKALDPKLLAAVNDYVDELLGPGSAAKLNINANYARAFRHAEFEETVNSPTVGPMKQVYALVEFDDAARAYFTAGWNESIVRRRLGQLAIVAGLVLTGLATVYGFLKFDQFNSSGRNSTATA